MGQVQFCCPMELSSGKCSHLFFSVLQNTEESYNKMWEILKGAREYGVQLNIRIIIFATLLAINQGYSHIAYEILAHSRSTKHMAVRNLKVSEEIVST